MGLGVCCIVIAAAVAFARPALRRKTLSVVHRLILILWDCVTISRLALTGVRCCCVPLVSVLMLGFFTCFCLLIWSGSLAELLWALFLLLQVSIAYLSAVLTDPGTTSSKSYFRAVAEQWAGSRSTMFRLDESRLPPLPHGPSPSAGGHGADAEAARFTSLLGAGSSAADGAAHGHQAGAHGTTCVSEPEPFEWRVCGRTGHVKPPRAHFDRLLASPVLNKDHFCPFVANCVGFRNYQHYLRFVFWSLAANTYMWSRVLWVAPLDGFGVLLLFVPFLMVSSLALLALWHVYLVSTAQTTIEVKIRMQGLFSGSITTCCCCAPLLSLTLHAICCRRSAAMSELLRPSPYDSGSCAGNWARVFGTPWLLAALLLPLHREPLWPPWGGPIPQRHRQEGADSQQATSAPALVV